MSLFLFISPPHLHIPHHGPLSPPTSFTPPSTSSFSPGCSQPLTSANTPSTLPHLSHLPHSPSTSSFSPLSPRCSPHLQVPIRPLYPPTPLTPPNSPSTSSFSPGCSQPLTSAITVLMTPPSPQMSLVLVQYSSSTSNWRVAPPGILGGDPWKIPGGYGTKRQGLCGGVRRGSKRRAAEGRSRLDCKAAQQHQSQEQDVCV